MPSPGSPSLRRWLGALVVAAVAAVYANTLGNSFVFDDNSSIVRNAVVQNLDVGAIFTTPSWWGRHMMEKGYRPLTTLSFALNHVVGGFDPVGYHLVNLVLHALVSLLVFAIVLRLGGHAGAALLSGLLFAVHPLNTEAVAWVTGRAELMSALFVLLALYVDLASYSDRGGRALAAAGIVLACFVCGLLSKENAVTLLPALAATDLVIRCRGSWRAFLSGLWGRRGTLYLALCLLLGGYVVWRLHVQSGAMPMMNAAMNPLRAQTLSVRWLNCVVIAGRYLWLWVAPVNLSVDYMFGVLPVIQTVWDWRVAASAAALAVSAGLGVWGWRRGAAPLAWGVLLSACTYSVVSNVALPIQAMMAERWMYLPAVGLSVITVYAARQVWSLGPPAAWRRPVGALAAVAVLLLCSARTFARNRDWRDPLALWTATLAATPRSLKAREGLGEAYFYAHRYPEAEQQLQAALQSYRDPRTLALLGFAYMHDGKLDAAQATLAEALARWPGSRDANWGLGWVALRRMQLPQAIGYLEQGRDLDPKNTLLRVNLGQAYYLSGRADEAQAEFRQVLQLDPQNGAAHTGLAACASIRGDSAAAVREYLEALRLGERATPQLGGQLVAVLRAYAASHRDADEYARQALRYFPTDPVLKQLAGAS